MSEEEINIIYNEIEEINTNFDSLSNDEIIECKDAIRQRLSKIMQIMDKYVSNDLS